jgi:hypothetical protein
LAWRGSRGRSNSQENRREAQEALKEKQVHDDGGNVHWSSPDFVETFRLELSGVTPVKVV